MYASVGILYASTSCVVSLCFICDFNRVFKGHKAAWTAPVPPCPSFCSFPGSSLRSLSLRSPTCRTICQGGIRRFSFCPPSLARGFFIPSESPPPLFRLFVAGGSSREGQRRFGHLCFLFTLSRKINARGAGRTNRLREEVDQNQAFPRHAVVAPSDGVYGLMRTRVKEGWWRRSKLWFCCCVDGKKQECWDRLGVVGDGRVNKITGGRRKE